MIGVSAIVGWCICGWVSVPVTAPIPKVGVRPTPAWHVKPDSEIASGKTSFNAIVADDRHVYSGCENGAIEARSAESGRLVWTHESNSRVYQQPSLIGDIVVFGNDSGYTALQCKTGEKVWHTAITMAGKSGDPQIADPVTGRIYGGGCDGQFRCLSAKDGLEIWTSDLTKDRPNDPPGFHGPDARFTPFPARPTGLTVDGDTIYVMVMDQCACQAISTKDGKRKWLFQTNGWVGRNPTVTEKSVFFGSQDKSVYCINRTSGQQKWRWTAKGSTQQTITADSDSLYVVSSRNVLTCLNQQLGTESWSWTPPTIVGVALPIRLSEPILHRSLIWLTYLNILYSIEPKTGQTVHELKLPPSDGYYHQPTIHGNRIYLVNETGLLAIDLK